MTLLKDHHPQQDLFIPDVFDNIGAPFKDDMASMEHPIFTLSKKKDMRHLEYQNGDTTISIVPSGYGLPTIFDKDILLYCMSLLMTEINAGRTPPKTLRISCRDLLVTTNRRTDGDDYIRLKQALDRLTGVLIKTNIKTNKREQTSAFGVFDSYDVIESSKIKNRMIRLEITFSDWFYNSIVGKEVLTISRDYFLLGKPMERRLYEIARKHCGKSPKWDIGLEKLMEKVGSTGTLRLFRSRLKTIIEDDHLPSYSLSLNEKDIVSFTQKKQRDVMEEMPLFVQDGNHQIIKQIRITTLEKARNMTHKSGTGWDFNVIIEQFCDFVRSKTAAGETIETVNGAFLGFVKHKVKSAP